MKITTVIPMIAVLAALGACTKDDPSEPRYGCKTYETVRSSRGGDYQRCTEHFLGCVSPLTLVDEENKLVCRLRRGAE